MTGAYRTVRAEACAEFIVHKSRFIGRCFPADTEERALELLEGVRKSHRDATHNCYAYSIGAIGGAARFSDDGEPGGTAGQPMMEVIRQKGVTDVLVVVTRYFGGVLLGAGGLVRAYAKAASMAIEAAGPVDMHACVRFMVRVDYAGLSALERAVRMYGGVEDTAYQEDVRLRAVIPEESVAAFICAVNDGLAGRADVSEAGRLFARLPGEGASTGE